MHAMGLRVSHPSLTFISGLALCLAAAAPVGAESAVPGASGPWVENDQARVRLIAARVAAGAEEPRGRIDLGLEFELAPGWHVYWKNSGDAGYPPRIDFSRTPALAGAGLLFPAPRRYDLPGGLVSFGYEKHVIYPISPRIPAAVGEKLPPVLARLDYLVCRAECIPQTAELSLDLEAARQGTGPEGAAIAAALTAAREALPREPGAVAGAPEVSIRVESGPASSLLLVFSLSGGTLRSAAPDLFFESHSFFALERPELAVAGPGPTFRVPFRPFDETKPMPARTTFAWTLTGLERAPGTAGGGTGGLPSAVALAGSASVEIPHLRTSETGPTAGLRPGLVLPLLVAGLFLVFFLIHRSRNRRS